MSILIMPLLACDINTSVEKSVEHKKDKLKSGIFIDDMDLSVKPGDDFYTYVNGGWIERTEIPEDKAQVGLYTQMRERAQANVKLIIEESSKSNIAKGSDEQKVGDLYHSFMDIDTRNTIGIKPLEKHFNAIDAVKNRTQLATLMSRLTLLGYGGPFGIYQYVDFKNPDTYMMFSWQSGLGLLDREYYLKDDKKSEEIRRRYKQYLQSMLSLAEINAPDKAVLTIYRLERKLALEQLEKEKTLDMVALYNRIPTKELEQLMPDFDWLSYLAEIQLSDLDALVVTQPDYMKALNDIFISTPLDDWKIYLKWKVLNASADRLTQEIDELHFAFYNKVLQGVKEQEPMWRRGVKVVNANIGEVVGKVYVKKYFSEHAKQRMNEMVNNLLAAYRYSIANLEWMSQETKQAALDKLSKITTKIGYPDKWRDYSDLVIDRKDYFGNIERSMKNSFLQKVKKQKMSVQKHQWDMNPQTVNAYYYPPLNEIVFPAAILQPPFFDLDVEDAVNYGAIGSVIGHEIGHAFDLTGSTFDGDGVLRNWWTDTDRAEFKKRTEVLVKQYSAFTPLDDLQVNGEFTLDENIGDLGGISIALKAYKLSLNGRLSPVIDGFTGEQRVFLGYGQFWRNKYRDKALRNKISTDEHAPSMYRVNGAVRNVPEFYSSFNVKEDHALYIAPEKQAKIW